MLIHQSVRDYLLGYGFCILDPRQSTLREILAAGHGLLATSCLWCLTDSWLSDAMNKWVDTFDPLIVMAVLTYELELSNLPWAEMDDTSDSIILDDAADARDVRIAIDALDPQKRHKLQHQFAKACNSSIDFFESWPQSHREISEVTEFEEWRLVDEFMSLFISFDAIDELSFTSYVYSWRYWSYHASKSINNGSWHTDKDAIQGFLSRTSPSHSYLYNEVLGILHQAAELPSPLVLQELLATWADGLLDINSICGPNEHTPLIVAIENGYMDNIRVLLQHEDTDINVGDSLGQTPLMHAIGGESLPIIELLIHHKANLDLQDSNGFTALMRTTQEDQYEMMEVLLHAGARTDITDVEGVGVIEHARDKCLSGLMRHFIRTIKMQEKEIRRRRKRLR